jgi:uncharacterized protein YbgA (DUF1722 family)
MKDLFLDDKNIDKVLLECRENIRNTLGSCDPQYKNFTSMVSQYKKGKMRIHVIVGLINKYHPEYKAEVITKVVLKNNHL